jgi:hypothetical protein
VFNISKFAAEAPAGAVTEMWQRGDLGDIEVQLNEQGQDELAVDREQSTEDFDSNELQDEQVAEQADKLVDEFTLKQAQEYLFNLGQDGRTVWHQLVNELAAQDVANDSWYRNVADQIASSPELTALEPQLLQQAEANVMNGPLGKTISKLMTIQRGQQEGSQMMQPVAARRFAQVQALETDIADKGTFIQSYIDDLLAYNGEKGPDDARSERAKNEILAMVSPAAHEEANSPLETIQGLSPQIDRDKAEQYLGYVFENWIAPAGVETQMQPQTPQTGMEPVMSENKNPKGIIKFNLSDQVLNNSHTVVKTAADQFGQQYLLYGPTEKRICPKLRGKGGGYSGSGDVVSEYICRHHCIDGIVIDDNKTICGEALWRANAMDKFSREYVDADGNIKGGYLNKRFEINRNVPEENKMRLKPGETRKVRPPEWGNTESRMQAMRQAEGEQRDYRPDTNTGDAFEWCHDVDQNNVQQSQSARDRSEEASGHQTVQYTNKDKQENRPKVAQAGRDQLAKEIQQTHGCSCGSGCDCGPDCSCGPECECKTCKGKHASKRAERWMQDAAEDIEEKGTEGDFTDWCGGNVTEDCIERGLAQGGHRAQQANLARQFRKARHKKKKSFNLAHVKTADVEMEEITGPYNELQEMVDKDEVNLPTPENTDPQHLEKLKRVRDKVVVHTNNDNRTASFNMNRFAQGGSISPVPADGAGMTSPDGRLDTGPFKAAKGKEKGTTYKGEHYRYNPWAVCHTTVDKDEDPDKYERCVQHVKEKSSQTDDETKEAKGKEKGVTYKGEHFKYNPWAVCNKSTGGKNEAGEEKFERCVQHVKDQSRGKKKKKKDKESSSSWTYRYGQMTGPRGPFGPDNPQSDDLGLSPDYDPRDDPELEEHLYREREPSIYIDDLVGQALLQFDKGGPQAAVAYIQQEQAKPDYEHEMTVHDWDDVVNGTYEELAKKSPEDAQRFMDLMHPGDYSPVTASKKKS